MDSGLFDLNSGVLAPVRSEQTVDNITVTGRLPEELDGTLLRIGPNPFDGRFDGQDMLSWWTAPSMVHGVRIRDGCALWYRNRWVRSGFYNRHHDSSHGGDPLSDHNPNVNVIDHGGRLLALGEGCRPFELTPMLDTIGPVTLNGLLPVKGGPTGMTAHPKIDVRTGEVFSFQADWQEPYLHLFRLDRDWSPTLDQVVELPAPVMMHDFAITETSTIFLDLNVGYDFTLFEHGAAIPLRWFDDKPARLGITPRSGGPTTWCEVDSCFIQHVVNAYDAEPDTIILDTVRYPSFLRFDQRASAYHPNPLGTLWRYTIHLDPDTGSARATEAQLNDRAVELPRIDERRTGLPHRFTYAVEQPTTAEMRGIVRYDTDGATQRHPIAMGDQNSEPIFVPTGSGEDDGWVLVCVYRHLSDTTDVVVLNASDISLPPVATIHLPTRIPAGFHGTWRGRSDAHCCQPSGRQRTAELDVVEASASAAP